MATSAPMVGADAKPYWDALAEGRLLIRECQACRSRFYYPRPFCPHCMSRMVQWIQASGEGTIYSYSLMRQRGAIVSAPTFVTLDEGPSLLTAMIDCDFEALAIGQKVRLKIVPISDGPPIPFFTPV